MQSQDVIEEQYREAVDMLVEKVQKDPYILAAIVAAVSLMHRCGKNRIWMWNSSAETRFARRNLSFRLLKTV